MATATSVAPQQRLSFPSEGETIEADLYGRLPAARAAILVHGQNWERWLEGRCATLRCARVPSLALHLRGYCGSSGKTTATGRKHLHRCRSRAAKAALRTAASKSRARRLVDGLERVLASSFEKTRSVSSRSRAVRGRRRALEEYQRPQLFVAADRIRFALHRMSQLLSLRDPRRRSSFFRRSRALPRFSAPATATSAW